MPILRPRPSLPSASSLVRGGISQIQPDPLSKMQAPDSAGHFSEATSCTGSDIMGTGRSAEGMGKGLCKGLLC